MNFIYFKNKKITLILVATSLFLTACGGSGGKGNSSNPSSPILPPITDKPVTDKPVIDRPEVDKPDTNLPDGDNSTDTPPPQYIENTEIISIEGKEFNLVYKTDSLGNIDKNIMIDGIKAILGTGNKSIIIDDTNSELNGVEISKEGNIYTFSTNSKTVTAEKLVTKNNEIRYRIIIDGKTTYIVVDNKVESINGSASATLDGYTINYNISDLGIVDKNNLSITNGDKTINASLSEKGLLVTDISSAFNGVTISKDEQGLYYFSKDGKTLTTEKLGENRFKLSIDGNKYIIADNKIQSINGYASTVSNGYIIQYKVNEYGHPTNDKDFIITKNNNSVNVSISEAGLLITEKSNPLYGFTVSKTGDTYTFSKDNNSFSLKKNNNVYSLTGGDQATPLSNSFNIGNEISLTFDGHMLVTPGKSGLTGGHGTTITNNGTIVLQTGMSGNSAMDIDSSTGVKSHLINLGTISALGGLNDRNTKYALRGDFNTDVTNGGCIDFKDTSNSVALFTKNGGSAKNDEKKTISMQGVKNFGIAIVSSNSDSPNTITSAINSGTIKVKTYTQDGSTAGIHDLSSAGIYGQGGKNGIINILNDTDGKIDLNGTNSAGIYIFSLNEASKAVNEGTIDVNGSGSYGMYAAGVATVINKKTINVGYDAKGALYAEAGATAINELGGIINIIANPDMDNSLQEIFEGNPAPKRALAGEGILINRGSINSTKDIIISAPGSLSYVVGTTKNGDYGTLIGKNIDIHGKIKISADITKGGYKSTYSLKDIIQADSINLAESYRSQSTSLLYNADTYKDEKGNLQATLTRNDKTLSDFVREDLKDSADIFGKYYNEKNYSILSEDAKNVLNSIDNETTAQLERDIKNLVPSIYSNIGRQIYSISSVFTDYTQKTIDSLEKDKYSFSFIGDYSDIDSRRAIPSYKSTMSGFVGVFDVGNELYANIGYGYSSIDYQGDSKGNIQSIHLGIDKFLQLNGVNFTFGTSGEYNFHKNTRDTNYFAREAKSSFDSYWIEIKGKLSKIYGDELFIEPFISLETGYGKYDSFTEKDGKSLNVSLNSTNYTSILPKLGIIIGKQLGKLSFYISSDYSYELGNMDKNSFYSFEGFDGKAKLQKDDIQAGNIALKGGLIYTVDNLSFTSEIGKNFSRSQRTYGQIGIKYKL